MNDTRLSTTSFATLADDLDLAIDWLRSLNAIGAGSRFFEYRQRLQRAIEIFESKDQAAARKEFESMAVALFEISEVNAITKSLRGRYDDELRRKYSDFSTGPVDYRREDTSSNTNISRNIGFELVVASRIQDAGLPLTLGTSTDVLTEFNSQSILIECKRPQSRRKVETRYKDASKQLKRKLDGPLNSNRRGIIALDATKIMNPGFLLLDAVNEAEIGSKASQVVDMFIEQNRKIWALKTHKRKIGILVRVAFLSALQSRNNLLVFSQEIGVVQTPNASKENFEYLRSFAQRLRFIN